MSSLQSLVPLIIIGASLILFFKWVGRDMNRQEKNRVPAADGENRAAAGATMEPRPLFARFHG